MAAYPDLPVITWSGKSAEIPQIVKLGETVKRPVIAETFIRRHVDLCHLARQSVRLPISSYRLGKVANYIGFQFTSEISGGFEATSLYYEYLSAKRADKARIRRALLEYNRDDLDALVAVGKALF
jgi:predicted RecB family nuclease